MTFAISCIVGAIVLTNLTLCGILTVLESIRDELKKGNKP